MGRAFNSTEGYFNRLPAAARGVVREAVWNLSLDNTGMFVPFMTDSTEIVFKCVQFGPLSALQISRLPHWPQSAPRSLSTFLCYPCRRLTCGILSSAVPPPRCHCPPLASSDAHSYSLTKPALPLWHMPVSGTAGADLFCLDNATATYRFVGAVEHLPAAANTTVAAPLGYEVWAPRRSARLGMHAHTSWLMNEGCLRLMCAVPKHCINDRPFVSSLLLVDLPTSSTARI